FLKFGKRRTHRVGFHCLRQGDPLLRDPTIRVLAIQCGAGHRSVKSQDRIKWGDRPIRPKSQRYTVIEKTTPRVAISPGVVTETFFRPAAVIDGVIGLHRSSEVEAS